jgi:flagellar assembly protein FliH
VSLETNAYGKERPAVALIFRRMDEITEVPIPATDQPTMAVPFSEAASFDMETELRAAYEEGRRMALVTSEAEFEVRLQQERDALNRIVQQFTQEKQRYFADVEGEVVKLALAIAERVLHREAEIDPLLLAGAVRVALEQVADSSEAVLRVAADDVDRWNATLSPVPDGVTIEVAQSMSRGDAVLKTRSGTVHLGIRAQLQEIERGFFELLGRKPSMTA